MSSSDPRRRVCVCVLGDIGRSPRMQYHSISLAQNGLAVDLIGFEGSKPHQEIITNDNIDCHYMRQIPQCFNNLPKLLVYASKVLWQSIILLYCLMSLTKSDYILVQNPPSVPTLAIIWIVCRLRGSVFVIDWHNYGFTILGLTLGDNHILVKTCKWFESYFGTKSDHNFCVTKALKNDLKIKYNIRSTVLYDRPPDIFRTISLTEKHNLIQKLKTEYNEFMGSDENETIFTKYDTITDKISLNTNRPVFIMSSTSWTEDEDFNILFEALELYDNCAKKSNKLPQLICAVTGKGPLKEFYKRKIADKDFKSVKVIFLWLTAQDYPTLVASADLGICLHKSSSNFDLPMKVVDMFGCCLPVCAFDYDCIDELVINKTNGLLFKTSHQLCDHLLKLFENFPEESKDLKSFRNHLNENFLKYRWTDCWNQNALPIFS
ncbi:chitobiosyldiphosphodolichol beta-mannosyltransferase-like [Oppia nitens]|uniref:chitobiosyldiphosphodolichol beta-mannosyltransferase-like n=1 Tax=Oppia nitens TaxID=1686743 RepID=UPI0023DB775C|nr:chitobiosyldiphosphodolichol beta-mannosyltransferase-like [Oppia nitens]